MASGPSPPSGFLGRVLAGLKRLLTSGGGGDLPADVKVSAPESPGSLAAFRGPGGGTLDGLGPGDWAARGKPEGHKSPPGPPAKG